MRLRVYYVAGMRAWRAEAAFGRLDVQAYGRTRHDASWEAVNTAYHMARQHGLAG